MIEKSSKIVIEGNNKEKDSNPSSPTSSNLSKVTNQSILSSSPTSKSVSDEKYVSILKRTLNYSAHVAKSGFLFKAQKSKKWTSYWFELDSKVFSYYVNKGVNHQIQKKNIIQKCFFFCLLFIRIKTEEVAYLLKLSEILPSLRTRNLISSHSKS